MPGKLAFRIGGIMLLTQAVILEGLFGTRSYYHQYSSFGVEALFEEPSIQDLILTGEDRVIGLNFHLTW